MLFRWLSRLFARPSTVRHFDYVIGLGNVLVPPHCTATLSARPNVAFRLAKLVVPIPREVAEHLMVCDVAIRSKRRLHYPGRVRDSVFLNSCVVRPGDYVSVTVYTTSDDNPLFQAGISGPAV